MKTFTIRKTLLSAVCFIAVSYTCYAQDINCVLKVTENSVNWFSLVPAHKRWLRFFEENYNLGFKKRLITFEYLPTRKYQNVFSRSPGWTNGLYINYDDQLIKFREGNNYNSKYYIEIPFRCLYSVSIEGIPRFITDRWISGITIQIAIQDPNGILKTLELKMVANENLKRGAMTANAAERCAADIFYELHNIIEYYKSY